jgi:ditrans,polycis-polyprenyl diphosphate synthase
MSSNSTSRLRDWLLASPPAEWAINQLRELLIGALRQGSIPKHVAFVMDGNRRFAKNHRMETVEGHNLGFEALARILEVCYKAGVTHVTIYAFSIENFKRSKYEVDGLMEMAKVKLKQLLQQGAVLDMYGAKLRVLGQRDLIKKDLMDDIDRAVAMTSRNGNCVLNVCFPYTSREEITHAVRTTVDDWCKPSPGSGMDAERKSPFKPERIANTIRSQALESHEFQQHHEQHQQISSMPARSPSSSTTSLSSGATRPTSPSEDADADADTASSINSTTTPPHSTAPPKQASSTSSLPSPESISACTLTEHMYTKNDPPIDLLVRTSGVSRLSDFMLWQCHENTQIVFLEVLWPDFDLWSFLPVLWSWQWRVRKMVEVEGDEEQRRRRLSRAAGSGVGGVKVD